MRMTLPEHYQFQWQHVQPSPKFQTEPSGSHYRALPFPGYTVTTPPWTDDSDNTAFYKRLEGCQQWLHDQLGPELFIPIPAKSLHLTLADLIWENDYQAAIQEQPQFEEQLRACIARIFQCYQPLSQCHEPVKLQLVGLMLMPRAIGVCLIPKSEPAYECIVQLRRAIYQSPDLIGLGIQQQYHFTAHVTLGYFGNIPPNLDSRRLTTEFMILNQQLQEESLELQIQRVELRKFDDMTDYYREANWPTVELPPSRRSILD